MPCLFVAGAFQSAGGVIFLTMVQTRAPVEVRGRVMSLLALSLFGLTPLAYGLGGLLGDVLGPRGILLAGAAVVGMTGVLLLTPGRFARSAPDRSSGVQARRSASGEPPKRCRRTRRDLGQAATRTRRTGAFWRAVSVRLRRRLASARAWSFFTASSERPIAAAVSATLMP